MKTFSISIPAFLLFSSILLGQAISQEPPFACDRSALTAAEHKRHFDELSPTLGGLIQNTREIPDGYEFQFPTDPATFRLVAEWAAGEHLCCPFFDIDLRQERGKGAFWLRLSGRPGVGELIQAEFAMWMSK